MEDTLERLKLIVGELLGVDEIEIDSSLEKDLGMDSLDGVEILMSIEEEFGIEIDDLEASRVRTISDALELIKKHL